MIRVLGAVTWFTGWNFTSPTGEDGSDFVMKGLRRKPDEFHNAYLKANPDVKP